jgi:hypothetical protein
LEIARVQGTKEVLQELYMVAERADGKAVREDDAEPEPLDSDDMKLCDGDVLTLAVKDFAPLLWRTYPSGRVELSKDGKVATQVADRKDALVTTGIELTEGRHYWEVQLLEVSEPRPCIGVCKPNLEKGFHADGNSWFIGVYFGGLFGNGKDDGDKAGGYNKGDRVGVLLDLNDGSLLFFRNSVQHGPGYPAGSVVGPVVHAATMFFKCQGVKLVEDATWPAGHTER